MGNHLLQHRVLSATAIGIAAYIQSLPEGTPIGIKVLAARFPEGEIRIGSALRELETHGYLERRRERLATGRVVTRTYSYNRPGATASTEAPHPPPAPDRAPAQEPQPEPEPEPRPESELHPETEPAAPPAAASTAPGPAAPGDPGHQTAGPLAELHRLRPSLPRPPPGPLPHLPTGRARGGLTLPATLGRAPPSVPTRSPRARGPPDDSPPQALVGVRRTVGEEPRPGVRSRRLGSSRCSGRRGRRRSR
ncbi:helix-turn-helix domain-containing protein [Streptomyces virginiae]|uniref:helix-turn-helix domain-containing protein n=1 Tax=Streptomyces virginiae TaxID=1961 RepID=UPI00324D534A